MKSSKQTQLYLYSCNGFHGGFQLNTLQSRGFFIQQNNYMEFNAWFYGRVHAKCLLFMVYSIFYIHSII